MAKMKNKSNLQVTFSKRRAGVFKKASELNTLCGADIAVIVFSPGGKVYSFGHPSVEILLNRFLNNNQTPPNQNNNNMRLDEVCPNTTTPSMNDCLTQLGHEVESEKKKNEEFRKKSKDSEFPNWWNTPAIELDLAHAIEFKGKMENVKPIIADEYFQVNFPHQNVYVGSSSGAPFSNGGYVNPNLAQSEQQRMFNVHACYNQNMYPLNYQLPYGNNNYAGGFAPQYNWNGMHAFNQYQNKNQNFGFREEGIYEYERHQDGYPPHL